MEIFTIGVGASQIKDFIQNLKKHNITAVIDIRSRPFSRYRPDFNRKRLEQHLTVNEIGYKFQGDKLGGIPHNLELYTNDLPDYEKIRKTVVYQKGLEYLEKGIEFECRMALLCACSDYTKCHRYNLVGLDLERMGYKVIHILKDGSATQEMRLF